jgi:hypothetical protein
MRETINWSVMLFGEQAPFEEIMERIILNGVVVVSHVEKSTFGYVYRTEDDKYVFLTGAGRDLYAGRDTPQRVQWLDGVVSGAVMLDSVTDVMNHLRVIKLSTPSNYEMRDIVTPLLRAFYTQRSVLPSEII